MLNREKFAKEILDNACEGGGFSKVLDEIKNCRNTPCSTCDFYEPCNLYDLCALETKKCVQNLKEWANSEYVETDWTKVPVDTPLLVRVRGGDRYEHRHFSKFKDGKVYAWNDGTTSWTAHGEDVAWEYAKLAESEGK